MGGGYGARWLSARSAGWVLGLAFARTAESGGAHASDRNVAETGAVSEPVITKHGGNQRVSRPPGPRP